MLDKILLIAMSILLMIMSGGLMVALRNQTKYYDAQVETLEKVSYIYNKLSGVDNILIKNNQ